MSKDNLEVVCTSWYQSQSVAYKMEHPDQPNFLIGIITVKDKTTGEQKRIIGEGFGYDQDYDIEHIIESGVPFYG